jgi:hypothetical protein
MKDNDKNQMSSKNLSAQTKDQWRTADYCACRRYVYKKYGRLVPPFHYVIFSLLLAVLIGELLT